MSTKNSAVEVAKKITALMPAKPKVILGGSDAYREEYQAYAAHLAAALGAWRYAAAVALNAAIRNAPEGWQVDHDNHEFIQGVHAIDDLEAMCSPTYPWTGRRLDQI